MGDELASGYNYYMTTSDLRVDDNQIENTFHCILLFGKPTTNAFTTLID